MNNVLYGAFHYLLRVFLSSSAAASFRFRYSVMADDCEKKAQFAFN